MHAALASARARASVHGFSLPPNSIDADLAEKLACGLLQDRRLGAAELQDVAENRLGQGLEQEQGVAVQIFAKDVVCGGLEGGVQHNDNDGNDNDTGRGRAG